MAQFFQGGGVAYDQNAVSQQNAKNIDTAAQGLAGTMLASTEAKRLLAQQLWDQIAKEAESEGESFGTYVRGAGQDKYSKLTELTMNLANEGGFFGPKKNAVADRVAENLSSGNMSNRTSLEMLTKGLAYQGIYNPDYGNTEQVATGTQGTQGTPQAPVAPQAPKAPLTPMAKTKVDSKLAESLLVLNDGQVRAGLPAYTARDPYDPNKFILGADGKPQAFSTPQDAMQAIGFMATQYLENQANLPPPGSRQILTDEIKQAALNNRITLGLSEADALKKAFAESKTATLPVGGIPFLQALVAPNSTVEASPADRQALQENAIRSEMQTNGLSRAAAIRKIDTQMQMNSGVREPLGNATPTTPTTPGTPTTSTTPKIFSAADRGTPEYREALVQYFNQTRGKNVQREESKNALLQDNETLMKEFENKQATKSLTAAGVSQGQANKTVSEAKKYVEVAPDLDYLNNTVGSDNINHAAAQASLRAARRAGNYLDNLRKMPVDELRQVAASVKKQIETASSVYLESAGLTNVATRRAAKEGLDAAAKIGEAQALASMAASQGLATSKLAEQLKGIAEAYIASEEDITKVAETYKGGRIQYLADNPDRASSNTLLRNALGKMAGVEMPSYTYEGQKAMFDGIRNIFGRKAQVNTVETTAPIDAQTAAELLQSFK